MSLDGDTVLVSSGTYYENIFRMYPSTFEKVHLTSQSGPGNTVINGNMNEGGVIRQFANIMYIEGFTITGGSTYSSYYEGDWYGGIGDMGIFDADSLILKNMIFVDNHIDINIGQTGQTKTKITNCTFICDSLWATIFSPHPNAELDVLNSIFFGEGSLVLNSISTVSYSSLSLSINIDAVDFTLDGNNIFMNPLFCDSENGDYTLAANSPLVGAGENETDIGALGVGCEAIELAIDQNLIPSVYSLHQNYPNPFNPTTKISYDLPEASVVSLSIYDLMGREIRTMINSEQTAGFKNIQWNATDNLGKSVPAGMYIYTIQAGEFRQTRKMVLLK